LFQAGRPQTQLFDLRELLRRKPFRNQCQIKPDSRRPHVERRWAAAVNRLRSRISKIIPGDWGKVGSGWLAQPLLSRLARGGSGGRIHQSLCRRSRAVSKREKGTERRGAMRSRSAASQVARAGFGPGRIAVTQRVSGCYCASARAGGSGGLREEVRQTKDAERRDKLSVRTGKDTRSRQDP
jgi:hypothetical protein